jgi:hypothetical protein
VTGAFGIMGGGLGIAGLAGLLDRRFRSMELPTAIPAEEPKELVALRD